ncbi:SAM hydrolase/SAM-dependent halogenase family protein [Thermodesulforhabdus norvegica]|uniref:Adenosyl-fluoride synthase n=1 Tax=Thermodesulforhabdus norvegica TaxID=39841 RepID=A0A1I4QPY6_9BACT|nr:SAM-dependent chlorinase/fluorinase [Thermodesulforhabdus norvegica]SFM42097.1 hypothetical protein SAMN05660836_00159 [Thermodesulforhabdus norvegica]
MDIGPIIGFASDLGLKDDSVALCKGLMISICPEVYIVDICHTMTPFDIEEGAWLALDLPRFFPEGRTIFAVTTYPATGTEARSIAVRIKKAVPGGSLEKWEGPGGGMERTLEGGYIYVAPNNGLLTFVLERYGYIEAYEIISTEFIPENPEPTFFSREMVAIRAACIAKKVVSQGVPLSKVGPPITEDKLARIKLSLPEKIAHNEIRGKIIRIDYPYGNVWTNISFNDLKSMGINYGSRLTVVIGDILSFNVYLTRTFADAGGIGDVISYINSRGYFSLGGYAANLADLCNLRRGMNVVVIKV